MTSFFLTNKIVRSKRQQRNVKKTTTKCFSNKISTFEGGHTIRLEKYQAYT